MIIRDATGDDAAILAQIFNDEVRNGTALWTDELVTEQERKSYISSRQAAGFPVFVAELEGEVVGYGSYGTFRPKTGYDLTVEHSVYVLPNQQGKGIGPRLLSALIDDARAKGFHVMIGVVEAANTASIKLHERYGFDQVGKLPQVGKKFGRWLDLALMQLTLDDRSAP